MPEDLLSDLQAEDDSIIAKRRRARMAMDRIIGGKQRQPGWAADDTEEEGEAEQEHTLREALDKMIRKHGGRDHDPMMKELREMGDWYDSANAHRRRRRADDEEPPMVEHMGPENLGEDDEDDELYDPLRSHLREKGMDEESIEEAVKLGRDHVRRRRSNGRDRMPLRGGKFDRARFNHGRTSDDEVNEIREQMGRIEHEPGIAPGPDRERGMLVHHGLDAMDSAPTRSQRARTLARYPGLARLGNMSGHDGMAVSPADLRSSTEKRYPGLSRIGRA